MKDHSNSRKKIFLESFPDMTVESECSKLKDCIAFSFKYFDYSQAQQSGAGQNFPEWSHEQLSKLCDKLKHYCNESIEHWKREPVGKGSGHILEIYGDFPDKSKTDFKRPTHVPFDVQWGRFRLESDMRLPGFIIDKENALKYSLNPNVFYVVFLDAHHQFYKS